MNTEEKIKLMAETSQNVIDIIQKRQASRLKALDALSSSPLDNIPDEVKKMREIEAAKIMAVMQEQSDLIDIVRMLFPKTQTVPLKRKAKAKKEKT